METLRERIKRLAKENKISLNKLEEELGFARGYLSKIDTVTPSFERLSKIANFFNVSYEYLAYGKENSSSTDDEKYYLDNDVREMAEFMYNNPEYKILFDASRKVEKKDILFVKEMMDRIRGNNGSDDTGC